MKILNGRSACTALLTLTLSISMVPVASYAQSSYERASEQKTAFVNSAMEKEMEQPIEKNVDANAFDEAGFSEFANEGELSAFADNGLQDIPVSLGYWSDTETIYDTGSSITRCRKFSFTLPSAMTVDIYMLMGFVGSSNFLYGLSDSNDNVLDAWRTYSYQANSDGIAANHVAKWLPAGKYTSYVFYECSSKLIPGLFSFGIAKAGHGVRPISKGDVNNMYRMYNPNSGEHFYTANGNESISLEDNGWKYEGVAWKAPKSSSTPVYRMYSGTDHHYTTNAGECNALQNVGWSKEGIGWYSDDSKGVTMYRLFNPYVNSSASTNNSGSHHYTSSQSEVSSLVAAGWKYEGEAWFGCKI